MLPEAHAQDVSSATEAATKTAGSVFKGVGRRYPSFHMGLDFMALSTPHYSANRAVFGSQYSFWGEYWPQDAFGVKGIYASQKYPDLSNASLSHATTTLAFLGKYRFDTGPESPKLAGDPLDGSCGHPGESPFLLKFGLSPHV